MVLALVCQAARDVSPEALMYLLQVSARGTRICPGSGEKPRNGPANLRDYGCLSNYMIGVVFIFVAFQSYPVTAACLFRLYFRPVECPSSRLPPK